LTRVSVFLITVALIAGMAGCAPAQYDLTISSTEGGEVTIPGEGEFTYDEGEVVNLVAGAEEGYHFVEWTGDVSNVADVENATTITMNYRYSITANFALKAVEIRTWYDLNAIRDGMGGIYILMNDLNSTTAGYTELASPTANGGVGWQPIGTSDNQFTGIFDGQGYEICNLFINRPDEDWVGFFSIIRGRIKDVGVVNATVTGDYYVGGLVGVMNSGTVSNSYFTGNVTGNRGVGGLVGGSTGPVSNSYSTGSVDGDDYVGGLVGHNGGTVSNSFWDVETSGQATSAGGTGKTTEKMKDIATFSGAAWNIIAVAPGVTNPAYTWNIVDGQTYPFLSWQPVS